MAAIAGPSTSTTESTLAPRPAEGRPKPTKKKKTSSLPSFEVQRFCPAGYTENSDNSHKKQRSRNFLVTWQEFVMDGFGPTMSLASLVSWQDMLSYSPPPQGADGTTTPAEIQDTLEAKKKKNARDKLIEGIQTVIRDKNKGLRTRQLEDAGIDTPSSSKDPKKPWIVSLGKASTFGNGKKLKKPDDNKRRRLSLQPKSFGDWASRAKRIFSVKKKKTKKKGSASPLANTRDDESTSSESSSDSPTPHQRLLRRSDAPTKITVRKASRHQPDLPSLLSGPSSSTVSIGQPVVGWTFLAPPGQPTISGNESQRVPFTSHYSPPAQLIQSGVVGRLPAPLPADSFMHRHSLDDINHNGGEDGAFSGKALLQQRMSVADSTKSHETLWRRSVSSPSIASSFTSLSAIQGFGSRNSSIWDYRGSVVSVPRDSIVSIKDVKHALRANLTGNLCYNRKEGCKSVQKGVSDKSTNPHATGMFSSSGHVDPDHLDASSSDSLGNDVDVEGELTSRNASVTTGGRKPSIVRKDHMDIYNHPYFEVAPGERHTSLSSVTVENRSSFSQRRATMDSIGSYRTALDGTGNTTGDASFVSF
ncbi:hypothetical protein AA313_de0208437 [Arthrobotrys entomopaga]|nr:hypothetical protein AA313_de0208437 [Arthrobotrys entomopaga]